MKIINDALSLIFPPVCGICGKVGKTYLCENCKNKLEKEKIYLPQIEIVNNIKHCYLFQYNGIIREKIIQYKFKDKAYLSNLFFEFFMKNEKSYRFLKNYDIIIPVPMSNKKISQRGYNQSKLIASKIANNVDNLKMEKNILIKANENKTQSTLNKLQRFENVKNVYKIRNEQKIKQKKVLLFDDIYTTGATSMECTKLLQSAGTEEVAILTIAKDFQKI